VSQCEASMDLGFAGILWGKEGIELFLGVDLLRVGITKIQSAVVKTFLDFGKNP